MKIDKLGSVVSHPHHGIIILSTLHMKSGQYHSFFVESPFDSFYSGEVKLSECEGIPITPEVLTSLEFTVQEASRGYECYFADENSLWFLRWENETDNEWKSCFIVRTDEIMKMNYTIKYLHELQKVYESTYGIELDVTKIFKNERV